MKDDERHELLQISESQLVDIDRFCKKYPYIDLTYDVLNGGNVRAGDNVNLQVTLEQRSEIGPVLALRYPKDKEEGWWLVVGDIKSNQLVVIKRVNLQGSQGSSLISPPLLKLERGSTNSISCVILI
ncbi:hypothetical protein MTR67_028814 [Solanum verrucosum]|uniref:SEC63 domain-containing protein n=1 Tax=Solanum verrucosum TaxID=315347 RepID=A0AAF0R348_SOLVR|nr:hypothetical protein MTR67_028814 [Solanum verrucosum]